MKIAVATCVKYHDAVKPFLALFRKFWPDCPYEVLVIDDRNNPGQSWCSVVHQFAANTTDPLTLLFQEDFFLNAQVQTKLIIEAQLQLEERGAAMVRLYPCPGSNVDYGHANWGYIDKRKPYPVSCQATIWKSRILAEITSHFNTPAEFEIHGSQMAEQFDEPFLAFKREVKPWPLEYYCSAISRGKWEPAALEFCRANGISVDTSMREIAV